MLNSFVSKNAVDVATRRPFIPLPLYNYTAAGAYRVPEIRENFAYECKKYTSASSTSITYLEI